MIDKGTLKRKNQFLLLTILIFFITQFNAGLCLDSEFEKNGELYILTTDDNTRGVYQLNNNTNQSVQEDSWLPATKLYDPGECRGIKVANDRKIYTFGHDEQDWSTDSNLMHTVKIEWRGNPPGPGTYYGDHAWHHAWHSGCSASNCLPFADLDGSKGYQVAVNGTSFGQTGWYSIKNGLWYHSMDSNSKGNGKLCYQDIVERKNHNYNLYVWDQSYGIGSPAKIAPNGAGVASSFEEKKTRHILNGCHDGCGVNNTNQAMGATEYVTDVTISVSGNVPKTYFYIRPKLNNAVGKIIKSGVEITSSTEKIIGDKDDSTAKFIGVSSRSSSNDFIYILGDNEIKSWLSKLGFSTAGVSISNISVSDMWWQTGGMVFALDQGQNVVYKFERNENDASIAAPMMIQVPSGVTDITSDGFGNLYYADTRKDPDGTSPTFGPQHIDYSNLSWAKEPDGTSETDFKYLQSIEKTVWKRNYYNGTVTKVGKVKVGAIPWRCRAKYTGSLMPEPTTKAEWIAMAGQISEVMTPTVDGTYDTTKLAEISAINLASPPQVKGYKNGHIDICGPYEYDQNGSAKPATTPYEENKIYQFRVENFPWFDDYGVNTNSDLTGGDDINGNGFTGGFVSTVVKKIPAGWPNADQSGITYTWKIIKTVDRYNNPVPVQDQVIMPSVVTSNPLLNFLYEGGEYQISVSANFHWYDYDKLGAGRLFSERAIVASFNTTNTNIAGNQAPNGQTALATSDAGFTINPSLTFGGNGTQAWAKVKIKKVDALNIPGGVGDIVFNPTYKNPDPNYPSAAIAGSLDSIRQKWDSRSIIAPTNDSADTKSKWAVKGNDKTNTTIPVFIIDQGDTAFITIKENQTNLPSSQYSSDPESPQPHLPPTYVDRLKQMFLDDSMGTYQLPDPNYSGNINVEQKVYCGNLISNPEFKYIVHNDPLVIPYTKVGANKLPTLRWKNSWDENTATHNPNAGPSVKWTWELVDSNGDAIIVGEHNDTLSPELNPVGADGSNMWSVPSAPGLYKLTVKINRIYVYNTFEEVGAKYNPSTGTVDKVTKAVEHAQNILIASECLVYVTDKTAPKFVNGHDGSGTLPHFYGFTGKKLNTVTSNPASTLAARVFDVYVEDDNPFDSGFRTPQLTIDNSVKWLQTVDPYDDPGATYKPIEFDINYNQAGLMSHDTAVYKLNAVGLPSISLVNISSPAGSDDEKYFSSTADKNQADPWKKSYGSQSTTESWVVNKGGIKQLIMTDNTLKSFNNPNSESTVKYTVNITNIDRFSKDFDANKNGTLENTPPDIRCDSLPAFHASNATDDSADYKFFFYARDSSGNVSASFKVAELEVIDNIRPNIFVKITNMAKVDMPGVNATITVPSNVDETYMEHFFMDTIPTDPALAVTKYYNGFARLNESDWVYSNGNPTITTGNTAADFPNSILLPPPAGSVTPTYTLLSFPDLLEDGRLKFEVITSDNVPNHFGGADSLLGAVDVSAGDPDVCMYVVNTLCTVDSVQDGSILPLQTIRFDAPKATGRTVTTRDNFNFRSPGLYYLVGYIRDKAPTTSRDNNVISTRNIRNFRYQLEISDTTINVHTLETE